MFRYIGDKEEEEEEFEREMERSRLLRIMMRGVKIGKKKGQDKISIMSIYERKKGAGV
jgi:small subunit ribosomal protein S33